MSGSETSPSELTNSPESPVTPARRCQRGGEAGSAAQSARARPPRRPWGAPSPGAQARGQRPAGM
eukprot:11880269-Alexandrium_andersonii.AAC.1